MSNNLSTVNGNNETDFNEYFRISNILLKENYKTCTDFLNKRNFYGFRYINTFNLGFDPMFYDDMSNTTWPAIIIPTGSCSFMAISIPQMQNEESICKMIGEKSPFNISALYGTSPIYIVQSYFDAISVFENNKKLSNVDYDKYMFYSAHGVHMVDDETAIALGGSDFTGLLDYLDKNNNRKPAYPLLISLNNDDDGYNAANALLAELRNRDIPATICDISGNFRSPNELDMASHFYSGKFYSGESLESKLLLQKTRIISNSDNEKTKKDYITVFSSQGKLANFKRSVAFKKFYSPISTGFEHLDMALSGGLYSNLIIIGAVSSLGKTAFVLQIADQIAKNEHDVLFFALEMSADELIARSISRETFEWCGNERSPDGIALSTLDIFNGLKENNNEESKLAYEHAMNKYGEYSEHMFIFTTSQNKKRGIVTYDIKTTRGIILAIEEHIRVMQRTPIIIIDYLQLLDLPNKNTKYNKGLSDKQIVDQNIFALKKISSDFNTPVIAVSSLNRASYNSKDIDFSAFKESGSIEYSCDTLIGLQFQDKSDPNEAKQKEPRDIEAVILKQRNGPVGAKINFSFHAKYNCFKEVL